MASIMTPHHESAILDSTFFHKKQRTIAINTKLRQYVYELYKMVNFWQLIRKTGTEMSNHIKLAVAMGTSTL